MERPTATEMQARLHGTLVRFGPPPAELQTEEERLKWALAELDREYRAEARPIIDRLVALESEKPPRPIILRAADMISGK